MKGVVLSITVSVTAPIVIVIVADATPPSRLPINVISNSWMYRTKRKVLKRMMRQRSMIVVTAPIIRWSPHPKWLGMLLNVSESKLSAATVCSVPTSNANSPREWPPHHLSFVHMLCWDQRARWRRCAATQPFLDSGGVGEYHKILLGYGVGVPTNIVFIKPICKYK